MELGYPTDLDQWIPVPSAAMALSPELLGAWAVAAARRIAVARGEKTPSPELEMQVYAFYPAPEDRDRCLYITREGGLNAVVDFATSPAVDGWRERLVAEWSEGVVPMRPIEVDDFDLPPLADGLRFVRAARVGERLDIRVAFAGVVLDTVVSAVGECRDVRTMVRLGVALSEFISAMEFHAATPVATP